MVIDNTPPKIVNTLEHLSATMAAERAESAAAVRACFGSVPVADSDVLTLAYAVTLARADKADHDLWYGPEAKATRAAIRELQKTLPGMIIQAEANEAQAMAGGRNRDNRFSEFASALLAATEPLRNYAKKQLHPGAWWHGWAVLLAREISLVYHHAGKSASFTNAGCPAIGIIAALLARAGVEQTPIAIFEALKKAKYF